MVGTRYLSGHFYILDPLEQICAKMLAISTIRWVPRLSGLVALKFSVGFRYQSYFHCLLQSQMRGEARSLVVLGWYSYSVSIVRIGGSPF